MKRPLIFLLLGPACVVATWLAFATLQTEPRGIIEFVAMCLFLFTLLVGTIAALVDGLLARALPAFVRALLVAIVGAAIPISAWLAVMGPMAPPSLLNPFGIGGALCMGVCSLLSNENIGWQHPAMPGAE